MKPHASARLGSDSELRNRRRRISFVAFLPIVLRVFTGKEKNKERKRARIASGRACVSLKNRLSRSNREKAKNEGSTSLCLAR